MPPSCVSLVSADGKSSSRTGILHAVKVALSMIIRQVARKAVRQIGLRGSLNCFLRNTPFWYCSIRLNCVTITPWNQLSVNAAIFVENHPVDVIPVVPHICALGGNLTPSRKTNSGKVNAGATRMCISIEESSNESPASCALIRTRKCTTKTTISPCGLCGSAENATSICTGKRCEQESLLWVGCHAVARNARPKPLPDNHNRSPILVIRSSPPNGASLILSACRMNSPSKTVGRSAWPL